ncbi:ribosomal protein S14 [Rivularia sp. PCC 7116]|uniref:30S ribosomal protein S14 n=1 Tax=Rivularia sp. PCC 7116 TaxID=373994 RepID=UPI00029EF569|nr:30S ribosomal protein S14 [Rivularia sp. PCC 7116]AFY53972.1 ribosomal protein S14 [Rivularia sp. PCC 7116]
MAKKAMVEREKKRAKMVDKYWDKRQDLLDEFRRTEDPLEKLEIHRKIQRLPRNSAPSRRMNRCWATGRPRAVYRDFGLCRNVLRDWAHKGLLPGVVKSSW